MEIDTGLPTSNQRPSGVNKRQKLNTTRAKILEQPAKGGASFPDVSIDMQFFDDPFAISREEVSFANNGSRV